MDDLKICICDFFHNLGLFVSHVTLSTLKIWSKSETSRYNYCDRCSLERTIYIISWRKMSTLLNIFASVSILLRSVWTLWWIILSLYFLQSANKCVASYQRRTSVAKIETVLAVDSYRIFLAVQKMGLSQLSENNRFF